jgi:signal transduction histidine kinase
MRQIRARFDLVWAERARIAHDLHDTLAQVFSAVGLQLDRLGALLDDSPAARERLQQARRMLAHARLASRNVVSNVRAAGGARPSLPQALEELTKLYEDVSIVVDVSGLDHPLPDTLETELLRIAEEAVSNAIAHGRARHVFIELSVEPSVIELWVRDDGAGFQPAAEAPGTDGPPGGFGLVGMRARASRIGGTLEISSEPGVGTEVGVQVPRAPGPSVKESTA